MNPTRYHELDALRGITAIMIVAVHFSVNNSNNAFSFHIGFIAVDLFFIISGFVILLTIEKNKTWQYFLLNRFSRLYPAYWICVLMTTIAIFLAQRWNIFINVEANFMKQVLANLTMLQNYLQIDNIDGSYWTLAIELQFYLFILLFLIFKKTQLIELIGGFCLLLAFLNKFLIDLNSINNLD